MFFIVVHIQGLQAIDSWRCDGVDSCGSNVLGCSEVFRGLLSILGSATDVGFFSFVSFQLSAP